MYGVARIVRKACIKKFIFSNMSYALETKLKHYFSSSFETSKKKKFCKHKLFVLMRAAT